ncbi:amino-acid acetyltransferase, mitochondrial [[Candida] anglica]|uniref:Amino-acid acetyltransferase, mitochondrial n=1 Tax=[Candida] anglica TaxID=148631 RepID=A0ABP0ECV6_9ASCO
MSKLSNLNRQFISNLKTHEVITEAKRNLILSILKSTTTKREARNYLHKYQNQFDFSEVSFGNKGLVSSSSNSLTQRDSQRELFVNRYLNKQNPFVGIYTEDEEKVAKIPLRIAIVKVKVGTVSNEQWEGMAETFKRLVHLGISPIIVLDYEQGFTEEFKKAERYIMEQASRVTKVLAGARGNPSSGGIGRGGGGRGLSHDSIQSTPLSLFTKREDTLSINFLEQLLVPLYQGIIPIIQPIVYNASTTFQEIVDSDELLHSLCQSLVSCTSLLSIEKVIMIDPQGGIPSIERNQTSHVFINLSQEYSDIVSELYIGFISPSVRDRHLANLRTMNKLLRLISDHAGNDDATGIITTPYIMSINSDQLNPIIYNVLTDRPVISSSLPSSHTRTPQLSTSILKKGMDVLVVDRDNYLQPFTLENLFEDQIVDRTKLINLINDSFGKDLDVDKYFARINSSLASIIILGDYDGAAIITWERESEDSPAVAYLDKFAIAKRNQGLPGLADVVFKAVLQTSPQELLWRSRKNNPVNKWYFERCVGTLSNPESQWKLFYTGEMFNKRIDRSKGKTRPENVDIQAKLRSYSLICESIEPSFKVVEQEKK